MIPNSSPNLRLKFLFNFSLQILGLLRAGPAALHFPIFTDEELFKVPFDALEAHEAGFLIFEPFKGGVGGASVDLLKFARKEKLAE